MGGLSQRFTKNLYTTEKNFYKKQNNGQKNMQLKKILELTLNKLNAVVVFK